MAEDIWSKERSLKLEKKASSKVRKALMKLAAAWANDPNYNSGKKDPDASTKVTTTADDTKSARTAEVVPRVPPVTMSTDTIASSTPGSNMPGTGGQQQKIAGMGLAKSAADIPEPVVAVPQPRTYTVARGDSLSKISERYKCGLQDLMDANKLKNSTIRVGQRLTIPQPPSEPKFDYNKYREFQYRLQRTPDHRIGDLVDAIADANPSTTLQKQESAIPAGLGLGKEYPTITKSSETRNIAEDSSHIPWWKKVKRHNDLIQEEKNWRS